MKEVVHEDPIVFDTLQNIMRDYETLSHQYKVALAYGSLSELDAQNLREKNIGNRIYQIWICPQALYMKETLQQALSVYAIPLYFLDRRTFGRMDAQAAWRDIVSKME